MHTLPPRILSPSPPPPSFVYVISHLRSPTPHCIVIRIAPVSPTLLYPYRILSFLSRAALLSFRRFVFAPYPVLCSYVSLILSHSVLSITQSVARHPCDGCPAFPSSDCCGWQ